MVAALDEPGFLLLLWALLIHHQELSLNHLPVLPHDPSLSLTGNLVPPHPVMTDINLGAPLEREGKVLRVLLSGRWLPRNQG